MHLNNFKTTPLILNTFIPFFPLPSICYDYLCSAPGAMDCQALLAFTDAPFSVCTMVYTLIFFFIFLMLLFQFICNFDIVICYEIPYFI